MHLRSWTPPSDRRSSSLLPPWTRLLGVTRVARVTGLDRTGVEVACAIRPTGHVLQVSNGKGPTFAVAARSALAEAAELHAAEQTFLTKLRWACEAELPGAFRLAAFGAAADSRLLEELPLAWLPARRLDTSGRAAPAWLPAQHVLCSPAGAPSLGLRVLPWTSNGLAAHPSRERAVLHALLEVMEREALAEVLPEGWTKSALSRRWVDFAHPRASALEAQRFTVLFADLTPQGFPAPVAGCVLLDEEEGPIPFTAGYACRPSPEAALDAALLEAAQSRLTEIHGAREEVALQERPPLPAGLRDLVSAARKSRQRRSPREMVTFRGKPTAASLAKKLGVPAAWVDLSLPGLPLHIVRVAVAGFRVSELL